MSKVADSCMGCFGEICIVIALWAMIFGVTVDGRRYALRCSTDQGVELREEP